MTLTTTGTKECIVLPCWKCSICLYFTSKQILHFGFSEQSSIMKGDWLTQEDRKSSFYALSSTKNVLDSTDKMFPIKCGTVLSPASSTHWNSVLSHESRAVWSCGIAGTGGSKKIPANWNAYHQHGCNVVPASTTPAQRCAHAGPVHVAHPRDPPASITSSSRPGFICLLSWLHTGRPGQ